MGATDRETVDRERGGSRSWSPPLRQKISGRSPANKPVPQFRKKSPAGHVEERYPSNVAMLKGNTVRSSEEGIAPKRTAFFNQEGRSGKLKRSILKSGSREKRR